MIPVYIPSTSRSRIDWMVRGPLVDLPSDQETYLVVPPGEVDEYKSSLSVVPHPDRTTVLPCPREGIAATRLWIGQHASNIGHEKFIMLDDDIRFLVRRDHEDWRLRGTTPAEVFEMLLAVHWWLDAYAHVSISAREGNNRIGTGDKKLRADCTRTLRALAYRSQDFLAMKHGRVSVMEDFDVNLQLLEAGIPNTCLHYWAQGQGMTNAPGGCSTYRTHELHEASARRLAELHPGIVSLRQKENKTDRSGFGTRTEVTIAWKKAYARGIQNARH